jgi:hypothetical protein
LIIFFQNQDHKKNQKMTRGILENEMPHRLLCSVSILPKTLWFFWEVLMFSEMLTLHGEKVTHSKAPQTTLKISSRSLHFVRLPPPKLVLLEAPYSMLGAFSLFEIGLKLLANYITFLKILQCHKYSSFHCKKISSFLWQYSFTHETCKTNYLCRFIHFNH